MTNWTEIKNDYIDETNLNEGFVTMYIDAWTGDSEEGSSIAEIKLSTEKSVPVIEITYKNNEAKTNDYAQEMIIEGIELLKQDYIKDYIS